MSEVLNQKGVISYIAMGSNLSNPLNQMLNALKEMHQIDHSLFLGSSFLYQSKPLGPKNQPYYLNAVIALQTELSPTELLSKLQALEIRHKRVKTIHWGARTLDLDILLYGNQLVNLPNLMIPHPQMQHRNFVLYQLADFSKTMVLLDGSIVGDLCMKVGSIGLIRIKNDTFEKYYQYFHTTNKATI